MCAVFAEDGNDECGAQNAECREKNICLGNIKEASMKRNILFSILLSLLLATSAFAGYVDNGNGTVTDTYTNLMWERQDGATVEPWSYAISYCEGLSLGGFTNWRLPNVKELRSILDSTKTSAPLISNVLLPISFPPRYWSSTVDASDSSYAWYVDFQYGDTYIDHKYLTVSYSVRCVR
jgi:hypothetical protein